MALRQGIIAYAHKLLAQGYSPSVVRRQLRSAGYSPYETGQALRIAGRAVNNRSSWRTWMLLGTLCIAGIVVLLFWLAEPEPRLTMTLHVPDDVLAPGATVPLLLTLTSDGSMPVSVLFELRSPRGAGIWSTRRTTLVDHSATLSSAIRVPESALEGRYSLRASARFDGKTATKSLPIIIERARQATPRRNETRHAKSPINATSKFSCPTGCDDFYACTTDACLEGRCTYTPIIPCCGNLACETGESSISCPEDCRPREQRDAESILAEAENASLHSSEQAMQLCRALATQDQSDRCFDRIAAQSSRSELCTPIQDPLRRDSCLMDFALEGDFSVCDQIQDRYFASSCVSLARQR